MVALFRAFSVEIIKLRRTLALWMMLITPLTIVTLQGLILLRMSPTAPDAVFNGWNFLIRNSFGFWVILMLPLFISLEAALIGGLEHGQKMWKHLFALPIPRAAIYLSKNIIIVSLVAGSLIILIIGIYILGFVFQGLHLRADMQWTSPKPSWVTAFMSAGLIFVLSWLMIALHTYIAIRWPSFILTLAIGIVATITSFLAVNHPTMAQIFPWSLPFNGFNVYASNEAHLLFPLLLSCAGGVGVAFLGAWDISRRDIL